MTKRYPTPPRRRKSVKPPFSSKKQKPPKVYKRKPKQKTIRFPKRSKLKPFRAKSEREARAVAERHNIFAVAMGRGTDAKAVLRDDGGWRVELHGEPEDKWAVYYRSPQEGLYQESKNWAMERFGVLFREQRKHGRYEYSLVNGSRPRDPRTGKFISKQKMLKAMSVKRRRLKKAWAAKILDTDAESIDELEELDPEALDMVLNIREKEST